MAPCLVLSSNPHRRLGRHFYCQPSRRLSLLQTRAERHAPQKQGHPQRVVYCKSDDPAELNSLYRRFGALGFEVMAAEVRAQGIKVTAVIPEQ